MKKNTIYAFLILNFLILNLFGQEKRISFFDMKDNARAKNFYGYWGYNRAYFSNSDIHLFGNGFDFIVKDAAAVDKPEPFNFKNYFTLRSLAIPQYNFRLGYFVNKHVHVSLGIDHMKYVFVDDQIATVNGYISPSYSPLYGGIYNDKNMIIPTSLLQFEHTNGLNLVTADVAYLLPILRTRNNWFRLGWNMGIGGCFVITKTDITIMGRHRDNPFNLSGYSIPVYMGPRLHIGKYFFLMAEAKGGYMNLNNVTIQQNTTDLAQHDFWFFQYYYAAGLSFPLGKKK